MTKISVMIILEIIYNNVKAMVLRDTAEKIRAIL